MGDPIVHMEIIGADGERLRDFYRDLFGWRARRPGPGDYGIVPAEEAGVTAGIGGAPGHAPYLTVYVEVPDVREALARAVALGGAVQREPAPVAEGVEVATFTDPEGHLVGLINER